MKEQKESWLDTITEEDAMDYMKQIGVNGTYAKIIEDEHGKFVAMSGKKENGEDFRCGMGQYAPINFNINSQNYEDFSKLFKENNDKIQITNEGLLWINMIASKNEGRTILDDNGVEYNYLNSFIYAFINNSENKVGTLQSVYEQQKDIVAEVYNQLSNADLNSDFNTSNDFEEL